MAPPRRFRAFARREVNLPATLTVGPAGAHDARLVNIGLGGACVETRGALTAGSTAMLEVTTPNLWEPLLLRGTIAWVRGTNDGHVLLGMRFEHERSALTGLVEFLGASRYD